jgi:hypothetical protein
MWVKGTSLHFIIDRGNQKSAISMEVVEQLAQPTMMHPQPYTIGWIHKGRDICASQYCCLSSNINPFRDKVSKEETFAPINNVVCHPTSIPSETRYCEMFLLLNFVMLFWANHIYGNTMLYMSLGLTVLLLLG